MVKDQSDRPMSIVILITSLDTTWRMFVPTLGGVFAGLGLDTLFSTKPFLTVICLALGSVLSGVLIYRQINNVRTSKK